MRKLIQRFCIVCCVACCLFFPLQLVAESEIPVTVKSFKQLAIYPVMHVSASVVSLNDSKLSAEVSAIIKQIVVDVGQTVARGSILLQLDSSYYQLEYERTKALLQSARAKRDLADFQLQRAKRLSNQKVVSDELLAQRESDLKVLSSEVVAQKTLRDIAKRNLDRCTVRAPFKAVVKARLGQVGELARIGTPLIHLIDTEKLEVSAKIQSSDIASLRAAKKINLFSQGGLFDVELKNITLAYDSLERSQEVRFSFVDTSSIDLPGAFGKIQWRKTVPHIPAELIVRHGQGLGVFISKEKKAQFISLANAKEGQPVAQAQLPETALIVVDGRYRLKDGSGIKIKQQQ